MKRALYLLFPVFLIAGCSRDEVQTYQVPKEEPAAPAVQLTQQAPAAQAPAASEAPSGNGFAADMPDTWTEKPGSGMRIVSYSIEGTSIDFYLISLGMGDVPSNVNRWRGQVGLSPVSPEQIASDVENFKVDGQDVVYVELYNAEAGKGIIGAIIDLAPKYWYFKAQGSADELKTHAADIRSFIESLRLDSTK